MTLILATQEALYADDSLDGVVRYRAQNKVVRVGESLFGFAGHAGLITMAKTRIITSTMVGFMAWLTQAAREVGDEGQLEGLCLSPGGLLTAFDQSGALDVLDTPYAAVGSGTEAAMAIMAYTEGEALPRHVFETVSEIIPSVSPRWKEYAV